MAPMGAEPLEKNEPPTGKIYNKVTGSTLRRVSQYYAVIAIEPIKLLLEKFIKMKIFESL